MNIRSPGWRESWRVLAGTLVASVAFFALNRCEMALMGRPETAAWLARSGLVDDSAKAAALRREAAQVAAASRDALERLPPQHRHTVWRLGYEIGFASEWLGSFALSAPAAQALARTAAEPHLARAHAAASTLGIGPVAELPVRTLQEFVTLNERFETDEAGIAARIGTRLSPVHRHLYLLGAVVGAEAARVESTGGRIASPPTALIERHATIAQVDPASWRALAEAGTGTPQQVLARYRAAIAAFADGLARHATVPATAN